MVAPNLANKAGTTARHKVLKSGAVPTSEGALYTVGAGKSAEVKSAAVTNTSGGSLNFSLSVVPSGDTAGATNRITSTLAVAAGATTDLSALKGVVVGPGDKLSALASGSGLVVVITGTEYGGGD